MKKFILKVSFFIIPLIIPIILIELFITLKPNAFNIKANYIKNNKDIEVLFLGSSHTQYGINPEIITAKSANLAYARQDYKLDSALFFNYIPQLINLKYVFLEIGYNSVDRDNSTNFRTPWYYNYHGISFSNTKRRFRYPLYFTSMTFFNNYIIQTLNPNGYKNELNDFGFVTNNFSGPFKDLGYQPLKIEETSGRRLKVNRREQSQKLFSSNKDRLLSIIDYCSEHDINVIVLRAPVFTTMVEYYVADKNQRRLDLIDSLMSRKLVEVLDYEHSEIFQVTDFKDDHHLNSTGAKKLTLLVDDEIKTRTQNGYK